MEGWPSYLGVDLSDNRNPTKRRVVGSPFSYLILRGNWWNIPVEIRFSRFTQNFSLSARPFSMHLSRYDSSFGGLRVDTPRARLPTVWPDVASNRHNSAHPSGRVMATHTFEYATESPEHAVDLIFGSGANTQRPIRFYKESLPLPLTFRIEVNFSSEWTCLLSYCSCNVIVLG